MAASSMPRPFRCKLSLQSVPITHALSRTTSHFNHIGGPWNPDDIRCILVLDDLLMTSLYAQTQLGTGSE